MCYNPRTIYNPSKHFDIGHDKVFLTVPCGHCGDCRNKKRTAYQVRTYYEFLHTKDVCKGYTLFVTLTYNDKSLPRLYGLPCFDYSDLQKFFKRVRKQIYQNQGISGDVFSYIVAMEYGGETCRPHYHLLIFVKDPRVNEFQMRHYIRDAWSVKDVIQRDEDGKAICDESGKIYKKETPRMGFIKFGNNRGIVDGYGAIEYVTKYVCKDDDFFDRFKELYGVDDSFIKHCYSQFKPKTQTSNNYGLYCLEQTSDDLLLAGKTKYVNGDGEQIVTLPLYLERKKFFDVIKKYGESPRYVINSAGIYARSIRFDAMYENVVNQIDNVLHNRDYITYLDGWLLCHADDSPYRGLVSSFNSPADMLTYVLNDTDFTCSKLADYMLGYRGFVGVFYDRDFDSCCEAFTHHVDTTYTIYDCFSKNECSCKSNKYEKIYQIISCLSYMKGVYIDSQYKEQGKRVSNYKRAM